MRLLLAVLLLCGCETNQDGCQAIAGPLCERAASCMTLTAAQRTQCVGDMIDGCCRNKGTCGNWMSGDSSAAVTKCVAAAPSVDCAVFAEGKLPTICSGVVRP